MPAAISDHDEGSDLDLFAAEDAPDFGTPHGIIAAPKDRDARSGFPSEGVPSDHEERPDPDLDIFAAEADVPSWVTVAPNNADAVSLFPSEDVTAVSASQPASPPESGFVPPRMPGHPVPWTEVPVASRVRPESTPREVPAGQWPGAAAAIAVAVLMSAGLFGTLMVDRPVVPLPAAPVDPPTPRRPLPAPPAGPTESVTPTPSAPAPSVRLGEAPARRSEAGDAARSRGTATRPTAQGPSVTLAEARANQPRGPASRPDVPVPSTSVPAAPAEPIPTASMPTPDVPTKTPPVTALTGAGSAPAGVAAPAAVPSPDSAPSPAVAETEAIGSILTRYRSAFGALDAGAVEAVWPSVNSKALANAFGQLESQSFDLGTCQINVQGSRAEAICNGWASFVPKVGGNRRRVEARQWTFSLTRTGTTWQIARVDSRQDAARSP